MLETDYQFSTPIYSIQNLEWLSNITKLTDEYLKECFRRQDREKLIINLF